MIDAIDAQRSPIRGHGAGHDLRERRLARAVLADQGVNLARMELELRRRATPDSIRTT